MDHIIGFLSALFWGVLTFSFLVFIHEGGHFLAARACKVRVTEFFLGLPCRVNIHRRSRRIGTKFGVTPILLGGYAAICGMENATAPCAARVLAEVHRRGSVRVSELADALDLSEDDVQEACAQLLSWGSVAPRYLEGDGPEGKYYPSAYAAMPRDAAGNTIYDGRAFDRAHATAEGEAWEPTMGEDAFYAQERSHTYLGLGFFRRSAILLAGIFVNVACGILLLMSVYSIIGFDVPVDVNQIGSIEASSPAEAAGLMAGDTIDAVNGVAVDSWMDVINEVRASEDEPLTLDYTRDGVSASVTIEPAEDGTIGIYVPYERYRLNIADSFRLSIDYVYQTVAGISQLLTPSKTMEVLDNSASVVGISVMSAQAAASGPATYLAFAALISLSLGFMNLLPIPPLDGGKFLIEIIQAIFKRDVPPRVQTALSLAGIVLFAFIFLYVLRGDILRLL
ncbi:M50 family metallopeptidase [Collinsella tanakaei]|uniref:M50 family metallopeptidase n=1 Tax=Collinsella tanakaei TaxID=626935 RepID=UPI001956A522|nr:site-2 protease family protein [Collinsella tanakaei]MBM6867541.1 site-2 protease family protein [Collinsella tanakaei]